MLTIRHILLFGTIYFALCSGKPDEVEKTVMIFQAVDDSFFSLWINWWAIALASNAFPSKWTLYLACLGGKELAQRVKLFHTDGCNEMIGSDVFVKHVYLAKWMAVTNAFKLGYDLLVIDLDAILLRNPYAHIPIGGDYDIIASRDHGPSKLPHAENWGHGRLCTGFIYIKYSELMREVIEFTLRRCKKYGHDQIQFNNALARAGVAWSDPPHIMNSDLKRHEGAVAWQRQYDLNFIGFDTGVDQLKNWTYHKHHFEELREAAKLYANFSVLMLKRYDVLRYCTKTPNQMNLHSDINVTVREQLLALHCFVNFGPLGEQGTKKKDAKLEVMLKLDYFVLKNDWDRVLSKAIASSQDLRSVTATSTNRDSTSNQTSLTIQKSIHIYDFIVPLNADSYRKNNELDASNSNPLELLKKLVDYRRLRAFSKLWKIGK